MSPQQQADARRYRNAWAALVQLARDGHSWSGRERNHLLLNRGGAFSDVSSVMGLNHDDDGRGLAVIDWDRDGDLDLFYRNRTAPRVRLMMNNHAPAGDRPRDSLAVKLEGTKCNRDAIGAVVEVVRDKTAGPRLLKSVRAGDLFLSQSSRWLHFGLGGNPSIDGIRVLWPGTTEWEVFTGAESGGRYLLRQGAGVAELDQTSPQRSLPPAPAPPPATQSRNPSIILPARIPLPPVGFRDSDGRPAMVDPRGRAQLVVLWSASCPNCQRELEELAASIRSQSGPALPVTALSVDRVVPGTDPTQAHSIIDALGQPFPWGFIEPDALARLDEFQRAVFDLTMPLAVPLAFLCDGSGNVAAIYRGEVNLKEVSDDLSAIEGADEGGLHALAPPFAGRWFTRAVDPVYAAEFMARQFEARLPEDALFYLDAARQRATGERQTALRQELAQRHYRFARQYKSARTPDLAAAHFERALALEPRAEYYLGYGTMAASYGRLPEAEGLLENALNLDPTLQPAREALALVRKLMKQRP